MAQRRRTWLFAICLVLVLIAVASWILRRQRNADIAEGQTRAPLQVSTSSFTSGDYIPAKFTCDGANVSPNIQLPTPPTGTKSFALLVDDPNAPVVFVHWIVYNIPIETRQIAEAASSQSKLPDGAAEGSNDFDNIGYGGPCPPSGKPHHYRFRLYALDINPGLRHGATKNQLASAIKGHILSEGQFTGLYTRPAH